MLDDGLRNLTSWPVQLRAAPQSRGESVKEGTFIEHLLGAGLAIGLGMCREAAARKQELSPWQSWLTDRKWDALGGEAPHL